MQNLYTPDFNLDATLNSGQIFRYYEKGNGYVISHGNHIFYTEQKGNNIHWEGTPTKEWLSNFFALNKNLKEMKKEWEHDKNLMEAIDKNWGLRVLRQEPWECTIAFICSSQSNIPKIKKNMNLIAQHFGTPKILSNIKGYEFPKIKSINNEELLKKCSTGFRAKWIVNTSNNINPKIYEEAKTTTYERAKTMLKQLHGIGDKVADCILLFALDFPEAFPVDVWVERVMKQNYKHLRTKKLTEIATFARKHYGTHAGWAQQYLFHNARTKR